MNRNCSVSTNPGTTWRVFCRIIVNHFVLSSSCFLTFLPLTAPLYPSKATARTRRKLTVTLQRLSRFWRLGWSFHGTISSADTSSSFSKVVTQWVLWVLSNTLLYGYEPCVSKHSCDAEQWGKRMNTTKYAHMVIENRRLKWSNHEADQLNISRITRNISSESTHLNIWRIQQSTRHTHDLDPRRRLFHLPMWREQKNMIKKENSWRWVCLFEFAFIFPQCVMMKSQKQNFQLS